MWGLVVTGRHEKTSGCLMVHCGRSIYSLLRASPPCLCIAPPAPRGSPSPATYVVQLIVSCWTKCKPPNPSWCNIIIEKIRDISRSGASDSDGVECCYPTADEATCGAHDRDDLEQHPGRFLQDHCRRSCWNHCVQTRRIALDKSLRHSNGRENDRSGT